MRALPLCHSRDVVSAMTRNQRFASPLYYALAFMFCMSACNKESSKEGAGKGKSSSAAKQSKAGYVSEKSQVLVDFASGKQTPLKWDAGGTTITFRIESYKGGTNVVHAAFGDTEKELADCTAFDSSGNVGRAEVMLRPSPDPVIRETLHVLCIVEGDVPTTRGASWYMNRESEDPELVLNDMYKKDGLYYEPNEEHSDALYLQTLTTHDDLTCGIRKDGRGVCWGDEISGEGTPPEDARFTMVDLNVGASCGIKTDKSIVCWGDDPTIGRKRIELPKGKFVDIAVGHSQMCAIDTEGKSTCWWTNPPKKRKSDTTADILLTHGLNQGSIDPPAGEFSNIEAEYSITCGLLKGGAIKCWGHSLDGLISDVPDGTFTQFALGTHSACALRNDGTLACWGSLIENGHTPPTGKFKQVDLSDTGACAIDEKSKVQCWGSDNMEFLNEPTNDFRLVSVGERFACGLLLDDSIACWGTAGSSKKNPKETTPPLY